MTTKVRIGNQTPTQSVILPYQKSDYKKAVNLYEKSKRKIIPWQKNLLEPILAINEDGLWTHTKVGYSIPRRNGKNEVVLQREFYGLERGEKILHTAHRTSTSSSAWVKLVKVISDAGYIEGEDYKKLAQKGLEKIEFFKTGGEISFRTRTSTGGLGEGFDLVIIDEAQEYTDDQETALKYVVSDSSNPQTLYCGTPPTLVSSGTVFLKLRNRALEGNSRNTMWAEWSVEDQSDVYDRELWYETNPSLGFHLSERAVEDEIGDDLIDFNIQRLGLWIKYNQKSAINEKDWERLKVANIPKFKGPLHVGIKYGKDGNNVAMSIAVKTLSGKIFIEAIDCRSVRNGNLWMLQFLRCSDIHSVVIDGAGSQNIIAAEMKEYKIKDPILPTVKEIITANAKWEQGIFQGIIRHNNQPSLTNVVTNCEKRLIGTQGGFGYKAQFEDMDIALMDSAILAAWSCSEIKVKSKQKVRY